MRRSRRSWELLRDHISAFKLNPSTVKATLKGVCYGKMIEPDVTGVRPRRNPYSETTMPNEEWLQLVLQNTCYPVVKSGVNLASPVQVKRRPGKGAPPAQTKPKRRGRGHRDMRRR